MTHPQTPPKRAGAGQLNLNTILLTICVGLSGWALKSIEDLKTQMAGQVPITSANSAAIIGINNVISDQSKTLIELSTRLTAVETKQSDQNKNNKN